MDKEYKDLGFGFFLLFILCLGFCGNEGLSFFVYNVRIKVFFGFLNYECYEVIFELFNVFLFGRVKVIEVLKVFIWFFW